MNSKHVVYIKSDNNYCHFYFLNANNELENKMLRITLKQVENQINDKNFFIRCHNSYIINTNQIVKIFGNSTNRKILLNNNIVIPVSRRANLSGLSKYLELSIYHKNGIIPQKID